MIKPTPPPGSDRPAPDAALAFLEAFRSRVLPGVLRRMAIWKRLEASGQQELAGEAMQELAVDCLAHPAELVALPERDRHTRWIRIVQRVHYALRERSTRKSVGEDALRSLECGSTPLPIDVPLSASDARLLERMLAHATHLKNGRVSLRATARALGVSPNTLAALRSRVARALGHDDDRSDFWRTRLADALCSTAAAWLRQGGDLNLWDDARRRDFEPEQCRARFARIRDALALRPPDPQMRQALELVLTPATGRPVAVSPRELLRIAERIAPHDESVILWRFEAEIALGAHDEASRCLRRARQVGADRVRIVLARARLLEARGALDAARALLARAASRHRGDPRVRASLHACGAERRYAPSATSIAPASSRSRLA